jgi:hypothetical protein
MWIAFVGLCLVLAGCATEMPSMVAFLEDLGPDMRAGDEIMHTLDAQILAAGGEVDQSVIVTSSVGFKPLLRAIEKERYPVETIILIGSPGVVNRPLRCPNLKHIISIQGETDALAEPTPRSVMISDGRPVQITVVVLKGRAVTPQLQGRSGIYAGYLPEWGNPGFTGDPSVDAFLWSLFSAPSKLEFIEQLSQKRSLKIFPEQKRYYYAVDLTQ